MRAQERRFVAGASTSSIVLMATGVTPRPILGSASAMSGLVAFDIGGEIGPDHAQRFRQFGASCVVQAVERVLDHVVGKTAKLRKKGMGLGRQEDQPGTAIGRIA